MTKTVFKDVVAYVSCSEAAKVSKGDIQSQLKKCGAKIAIRLTKSVTHCVFVEGGSDIQWTSELINLYKRIGSLSSSPVVVGLAWIDNCIAKKRKLSENKYTLPCPQNVEAIPPKNRSLERNRSSVQDEHDGIIGLQTQAVADILANDLPQTIDASAPINGKSRFSKASGTSGDEPPGVKPNSRAKNIIRVGNIEGIAQRFSVRQLQRQGEKPVLLHRGTPWAGAMPPATVVQEKKNRPIYIPGVDRVESPWNALTPPDDVLARQEVVAPYGTLSGSKPEKKGRKSSISTPWSHLRALTMAQGKKVPSPWTAVRPWDIKPSARPSLLSGRSLLTSSTRDDATPVSIQQHATGSTIRRKHSMASQLGLFKESSEKSNVNKEERIHTDKENITQIIDSNTHGGAKRKRTMMRMDSTKQAQERCDGQEKRFKTQMLQRKPFGNHRHHQQQGTVDEIAAPNQCNSGTSTDPKQASTTIPASIRPATPSCIGHIAVTSTTSSVMDLVKSAVRRLRGIRICPDGQEESSMTHLIIGDEKRTLKTMLGVANGAWMMTPEWVTASLEAGYWLPEEQYVANVRFARGAERARAHLAAQGCGVGGDLSGGRSCKRLLSDQSVYVHLSSKAAVRNAVALKRLALALGAKSAKLVGSCTICVVAGKEEGVKRPSGLPSGVPVVEEEWLLQAAEQYEKPLPNRFICCV